MKTLVAILLLSTAARAQPMRQNGINLANASISVSSLSVTGGYFSVAGSTFVVVGGAVGIGTSVPASTAALQVNGTIIYRGVTDGIDASSGTVGEYISTSPVSDLNLSSILTATLVTIATTTLSPGDWMVGGQALLGDTGATITGTFACISLTPAACSSNLSVAALPLAGTATAENISMSINPMRVNVTVNTAVYLTVRGDYSAAGTAKWAAASQQIWARRVR